LSSDYAYKQVAHLANNIGPRLSGSPQSAKSVDYVANELKAIGCEVQLAGDGDAVSSAKEAGYVEEMTAIEKALAEGRGDDDFTSLIQMIEKWAGVVVGGNESGPVKGD